MGFSAVKTLCLCNGTAAPKEVLPSCSPILKAAARSKCGPRRMLISIVILLIMVAIVYCMCVTNQQLGSLTNRLSRIRPQPQPVAAPPPPPVAEPPPMEEPVASAEPDAEPATEEAAEQEAELNTRAENWQRAMEGYSIREIRLSKRGEIADTERARSNLGLFAWRPRLRFAEV